MTDPDGATTDAVALEIPDEPVELRAQTRALAEESPEQGHQVIETGEWIARPLWDVWGDDLERAGFEWPQFLAIVCDYRRELWLWVMGERTWAQCAAGLAGRVSRRRPGV